MLMEDSGVDVMKDFHSTQIREAVQVYLTNHQCTHTQIVGCKYTVSMMTLLLTWVNQMMSYSAGYR